MRSINKTWFLIGSLLCVQILCTGNTASASEPVDWLSGQPTINFVTPESIPRSTISYPCHYESIMLFNPFGTTVSVGAQTVQACVHSSKSFRLARVSVCVPNNWGGCQNRTWMVIGLTSENLFYRVDGLYDGPSDDCWQTTPASDTIYYTCNNYFYWVSDLTSKLKPVHGSQEEFYEFDNANYTYLRDDRGELVKHYGAYISADAQWALVAMWDTGLLRINLNNMQVKLFSKEVQLTNFGFDPWYDLSIDDSARFVAVGGQNAGAFVYDIASANCGEVSDIVKYSWHDRETKITQCPYKNLAIDIAAASGVPNSGFKIFSNMYISHDATLITGSYTPMQQLSGARSGSMEIRFKDHKKEIKYIGLGDSYSSGEGDIPKNGVSFYTPETDYVGGCHLSTRSYPYILTNTLRINTDTMKSVACSGAKLTDDLIEPFDSYQGQGNRLQGKTIDEILNIKIGALTNFIPGLTPQIEFVKKYKPAFITLTAGGNDVGFAEILTYCAGHLYTCYYAQEHNALHDSLLGSIKAQKGRITKLIQQVKSSSPTTVIYILGYPKFLANNTGCQLSVGYLNGNEKRMINDGVELLNQTTKIAAMQEGAYYVDIQEALYGGRLCEGTHDYVSGLDNLDGGVTNSSADRNQAFHPNANGHAKIAQALVQGYPHIMNVTSNPMPAGTQLEAPLDKKSLPDAQRSLSLTYTESTGKLFVQVPTGSFKPNSSIEVAVYSHEYKIGNQKAAADGSFSKSIVLPSHFEDGEHVVVVKGRDAQGNSRYLYGFITIGTSGKSGIHGKCIEHSANNKTFNCTHLK